MKRMIPLFLALILALGMTCAAAESAALPEWTYTGEDPITAAVAAHMARMDSGYTPEEGGVLIPTPILLKTEVDPAGEKATVYGNFWIFCYRRNGRVLESTCGGELPGIMKLEKKDGTWTVVSMETARDGEGFSADIARFAGGDEELEKEYYLTAWTREGSFLPQYRRAAVVAYVLENHLDIVAYREPGREPVSVID